MAASIVSLIDTLPNRDDKIEVLEDLKVALGNLSNSTIASIVANASFNGVFDCLVTDNKKQLEVCCDVLSKLLTPLQPVVVLTQFQDELRTGLSHEDASVRKLCLIQMKRVADMASSELLQFEDLLVQVIRTVADESLEVAKFAGEVLQFIGDSRNVSALLSGQFMSSIQDVLTSNDTIRFRMYEVLVRICTQSNENLYCTASSGFLQQFLNELHKPDVLLQLNCLELLSDLALTEHGMLYLEQLGVIATLETMMQTATSDPLAGFLIPGLVKFFGCVARLHPKEVCTNNTVFVSTVFGNLTSPESPSMLNLSIQTVGFIGSTVEGKLALDKLGNKMKQGVRCIGKVLRDSQQDTKVITLQALNSLLKLRISDQTSDLLKVTECWYEHLGSKTFNYLMTIADQPFTDLRVAVLSVFESMASQAWGQDIMNNHAGFKEYLLNRSTEKTKEGKEGKYAVVQTLVSSSTVPYIFGQPYFVLLKAYLSQGPFYVRAQAEVAMEGES